MALFRRILVPHDFSTHADHALRVAADLARAERGRLVVLHVIPPLEVVGVPGEMVWIPPPLPIGSQRRRLERLVARVQRGSAPRAACRIVVGDPFARIVEAARDADVIVMSTAGHTGLSHLLIGSVAEKVVRHSPVPVLTIRPGAARAAVRRRATRRRATTRRAARRR